VGVGGGGRCRIGQTPIPAGSSLSSVSFPTCCSALPESAHGTTIALVLGWHQRNNKHCFISVWWMKSFNETGPNCSGKLPYFCVLNGSDPSAARIVCLHSPPGCACLAHPPYRAFSAPVTSLFWSSGLDQWGDCPLYRPHHATRHCWCTGEWLHHCMLWCHWFHWVHSSQSLDPGTPVWYNVWQVLITLAGCSFIRLAYLPWARL
jgi:hypothetical protein